MVRLHALADHHPRATPSVDDDPVSAHQVRAVTRGCAPSRLRHLAPLIPSGRATGGAWALVLTDELDEFIGRGRVPVSTSEPYGLTRA
jgi:hypothetical protein